MMSFGCQYDFFMRSYIAYSLVRQGKIVFTTNLDKYICEISVLVQKRFTGNSNDLFEMAESV